MKAIRDASPQARHHFTVADQVEQLVTASEADPERGFMARTMALCSLPRSDPGNRKEYVRRNGPYTLVMTAGFENKLPYGNLPAQWFQQEVPLDNIEQAILLGCGRKYVAWLNGGQGQPIGSLHCFSPILEEVAVRPLSDSYRAFNRWQVWRLEQRCLRAQKDPQTSQEETAWENFGD